MTRSARGPLRVTVATVLVVVLVLVGGRGSASAAVDDELVETTDRLLFGIPLRDFIDRADHENKDRGLVWVTGGCLFGEGGFDFGDACRRHDFGYRNLRAQNRLTPEARRRVDDRFLADVYALCGRYQGWESFRGVACRGEGRVLHALLRGVGRVYPAAAIVSPSGRVVRLYTGAEEPFAVGRIGGGAPGDAVWVDRSWNLGVTWIQLGLTRVQPFLTSAVTPPMWDRYQSLRACGQARGGAVACTRWVTV